MSDETVRPEDVPEGAVGPENLGTEVSKSMKESLASQVEDEQVDDTEEEQSDDD